MERVISIPLFMSLLMDDLRKDPEDVQQHVLASLQTFYMDSRTLHRNAKIAGFSRTGVVWNLVSVFDSVWTICRRLRGALGAGVSPDNRRPTPCPALPPKELPMGGTCAGGTTGEGRGREDRGRGDAGRANPEGMREQPTPSPPTGGPLLDPENDRPPPPPWPTTTGAHRAPQGIGREGAGAAGGPSGRFVRPSRRWQCPRPRGPHGPPAASEASACAAAVHEAARRKGPTQTRTPGHRGPTSALGRA